MPVSTGNQHKDYKPTLDHFMSFLHGRVVAGSDNAAGDGEDGVAGGGRAGGTYNRNRENTRAELLAIQPLDIVRWFNYKAYRIPDPPPGAFPIHAHANSLKFYKKALLYFMPNTGMNWDVEGQRGNPTKSPPVNRLVAHIKRVEARQQRAASHIRCSMSEREFGLLHDILKRGGNPSNALVWEFGIPALINYQFHLMARIDDVTQEIVHHVRIHNQFPDKLKRRLNWSKNVFDERDAPWQVILGSCNSRFCTFISLGL